MQGKQFRVVDWKHLDLPVIGMNEMDHVYSVDTEVLFQCVSKIRRKSTSFSKKEMTLSLLS